MTSRALDFPLDIIWPRLIAIADEMATTLFRTAFSHDVVEVHVMSTGLYEEGLIIPLLRLYREGQPNEDFFSVLRRNVRFSEKMIGDVRAQVAAGWIGTRAMEKLAREFDLASLRPVADEIIRRTEAGMRAGIAKLPDGQYRKQLEMEIQGVDEPQAIVLTLAIRGDSLTADFAGTSPQVRRPVNSPIHHTPAYLAGPIN